MVTVNKCMYSVGKVFLYIGYILCSCVCFTEYHSTCLPLCSIKVECLLYSPLSVTWKILDTLAVSERQASGGI